MVILNDPFDDLASQWIDGTENYVMVAGAMFQIGIPFLFGAIMVEALSLAYIVLVEEWEYRKSD